MKLMSKWVNYRLIILTIFVLFGNEYAQIYFPFQIMFADQSLTARRIQIMLLLHQMMRYKESLLFLLVGSTLQRMIMEFMISSTSDSSKSSSVSSLKWRWRYVEDILFKFCALSYLEGGFSPCGFASFLTFLDIIIVKGWP